MSETMTDALKPCPFCGRIPYTVDKEHTSNGLNGIICGRCDARIFGNNCIKLWNARAEAAQAPARAGAIETDWLVLVLAEEINGGGIVSDPIEYGRLRPLAHRIANIIAAAREQGAREDRPKWRLSHE